MSVSRGCFAIERDPGKWYCVVACDEYDYDFHGSYTIYGPKSTADAAVEAMHKRAANPGSGSSVPFDKLTPHYIHLVDTELERQKELRRKYPNWYF